MVSVAEALRIVFSHGFNPVKRTVPIAQAVGKVVAIEIKADRNFPPFDRVAMDGIAVAYERLKQGQRRFLIEGVQAAGEPARSLVEPAHAIEVMTGAVLPVGTDTVIRYEDISINNGSAEITLDELREGMNIHRDGQDAKEGEVLLDAFTLLSPAEIALLASVGVSEVPVLDFPTTAIISSGDELIPIHRDPLPHQIRRSNVYALQAAMEQMGWVANMYHLPDDKTVLLNSLREIVSVNEILILSGGVSKGKFDFIPEVLESIGIKKKIQHVAQRPGKPFWFGVSDRGKVAFALPGNPVSTFMCFYRFIKPWALKSLGQMLPNTYATLASDVQFLPSLTYFLQVSVVNEQGRLIAYPQPGGGSGDFANLKDVTGFLQLDPPEKNTFQSGEVFPYIAFR